MSSPITNAYDSNQERPKLEVECVRLFEPETEWTYSHHPSITHFNGRFHAIWSNGLQDEDAPSQRVLMATADDFATWSEPKPLVDTLQGKHSPLVLTASGFHQHDGELVAYFGQYEYLKESLEDGRRPKGDHSHMDTCLRALTTTDGETWSDLIDIGIPIVPNHPPQPTTTGRLIISGNISFPYTDDPRGLTGWRMAGIYGESQANGICDDSQSFHKISEGQNWPVHLCEGSFYQTDDGVLHMLLRSGTPNLWLSESSDSGTTWSKPVETSFTDNATKFHFGRLPDGRFYYVGCPDPEPRGRRSPLVLSLSGDGYRFDKHYILADEPYERKREGLHKGGLYGYPHTMVHGDHLYAIFSLRKEAMAVLRTPLSAF